jgi:hypothetical protein
MMMDFVGDDYTMDEITGETSAQPPGKDVFVLQLLFDSPTFYKLPMIISTLFPNCNSTIERSRVPEYESIIPT